MKIDAEILTRAERILGYRFNDRAMLETALTHASIADSRLVSNERLEFLGDAVLGMLVCNHLYETFEDLLEGDLTKIKSAAVSRRMCARITDELGLDKLLVLGKGMKTKAALPSSLSAAVLESVIGAIYLDGGLEEVQAFLIPLLKHHIDEAAASGHQQNFKSVLQQYGQRELEETPVYLLLDEQGPDHAKCFLVGVEMGGRRYDACWAPSKKQAEQQAALRALETLGLIERNAEGKAVYTGGRDVVEEEASVDLEEVELADANEAEAN